MGIEMGRILGIINRMKLIITTFCAVMILGVTAVPKPALAVCTCCTEYFQCITCSNNLVFNVSYTEVLESRDIINEFVTDEFVAHRQWYVAVLWEDHILPAMMLMADQLSAVAMHQTMLVGGMMDAKHQMETQRVLQTIRARAHKDYHPSNGMCEFGTNVRSLAASERKSELNAHVMAQRSQDRHLGNANVASAAGPDDDFDNRLEHYKRTYCDPMDSNKGLELLCDHDGAGGGTDVGATDLRRVNKDLDYVRAIEFPKTLNIDFTDTDLTDEEEDVLALASNLYGDVVFSRIPSPQRLADKLSGAALRSAYLDMRALLAKRSVAENSFNAITSMKAAGTAGSRDFLAAVLEELGVPTDDNMTRSLLGFDDDELSGFDFSTDPVTEASGYEEMGPSYDAQMEILTKKIYQNPDFYTNLYDKPANVERKKVAMQAIGLMQKFDLYKSYLRNEANLSVLLELAIVDLQTATENSLSSQD